MLVSIITVCYNSEKTIRRTIESVLGQTWQKIEYIVVDGLSTDHTPDILREYEEKFREKGYSYRVIREKDNGIYDAMNKGIRMATGELVGLINSDDWYESIAVQTAAEAYGRERYDMFYGDIHLVKGDGSVMVKRARADRFPSSRHWNHPTTFIPKAAYAQMGMYRCQSIYDDFDLFLRFRRAGKRMVICNQVLANFRTGGISNQKSLRRAVERCGLRYRCYRNNGYSPLYMFECVAMEAVKLWIS